MKKEFDESNDKPLEPTRRNLIKYWSNYFVDETNKTAKKHINSLIQLDRYNIRAKKSNNTKFSNSLKEKVEKSSENIGKNTNLAVIEEFVELEDYVTLAWGKRPKQTREFDDETCKKLNDINHALRETIIDNNKSIYKIGIGEPCIPEYPVHPSIPMVAYEPSITNIDENDIEKIFKESEF